MSAEEQPTPAADLVDETARTSADLEPAGMDAAEQDHVAGPAERSDDESEDEVSLDELETEIGRAEELHGELSRRLDAAGRD